MQHDGRMTGTLYLAATPIGNTADASPRLREVLMLADVVAAEDSRRAVRLFRDLDLVAPGRLMSFYDAVEIAKTPELISVLLAGQHVVLITDAGMPSVSDPGYRLVAAAIEAGVHVTVVPGPSAVLAALAVSGLPVDRFCFEGFLPRQGGPRRKALQALAAEPRTMVFFEAPHRVAETLADMVTSWGSDRPAALCRELTKTYEEVVRGTLADLVKWADGDVRGEVTLVVAGRPTVVATDSAQWIAEVEELVAAGDSTRDAVADVAARLDVPKRHVYDAVMEARRAGASGPPS